jgi:hypothetical protein
MLPAHSLTTSRFQGVRSVPEILGHAGNIPCRTLPESAIPTRRTWHQNRTGTHLRSGEGRRTIAVKGSKRGNGPGSSLPGVQDNRSLDRPS